MFFILAYALPAYYHTTDDIVAGLESYSDCIDKLHTNAVHAYKIPSPEAPLKTFLLFGEHPRELISSETGFELIKKICDKRSDILKTSEFLIVVNANPISRREVEDGDYCLRTNEHGVDINRNWSYEWEENDCTVESETCSGDFPFSEPESTETKNLLHAFGADIFITIHSGTLGLYTPWAYCTEKATDNEGPMIEVLQQIHDDYCDDCAIGAAGKTVGYKCPGTCLDYAYADEGIQWAFAWEIYKQPTTKFFSFLQTPHKPYSCFVQTTSRSEMSPAQCLGFFNPMTEEDYDETIDKWSDALLDTVELIHERAEKQN